MTTTTITIHNPAAADNSFFDSLDTTCNIVSSIAAKRGKIPAIAECGVRVMKKDGSDNEGLLVKGNPVGTEASGKNWYQEVSDIAKKNNMPYYLVWANFGDTNFYVPYKYDDTHGQELINDFIKYYNDDSSIFGGDTGFYSNMGTLAGVSANTYTGQMGYMVYPFDRDTILKATTLKAGVKNASKVQFVINNPDTGVKLTLTAEAGAEIAAAGSEPTLYTADLTEKNLSKLGKTDTATITLLADGEQLAQLSHISLERPRIRLLQMSSRTSSTIQEATDFWIPHTHLTQPQDAAQALFLTRLIRTVAHTAVRSSISLRQMDQRCGREGSSQSSQTMISQSIMRLRCGYSRTVWDRSL